MNNKGEKTDILSGLKKSSLFQHLSEPELSTVSLISSLNKFEKGAALFSQGDRGGDVFIIVSGSVDVFIHQGIENKKKIATYKKGDFFGELAFFLKDIRIGTALACEKTTVVVMNKKIYDLASIFRTPGFVDFLKKIANRAGATLKEISQSMTSNKNVRLQFLNHLPSNSVEEQSTSQTEDLESLLSGNSHFVRIITEEGIEGVGQSACWGYMEAVDTVINSFVELFSRRPQFYIPR